MALTSRIRDASLHILQHALGLDDYGQGTWYRNYYVADANCDGFDLCMQHVAEGRMSRRGPSAVFGGSDSYCFVVTEAGKEYVREHSPKPPKLTRGQKRYQAFLRADSGLSFREWLRERAEP